ncbi:MAG: peptidylprolyl isomerase [bacterium]
MRTSSRPAVALLVLALAATAGGAGADSVVAVVGETAILESELSQAADFYRLAAMDSVTPAAVLREQTLASLVSNLLLEALARQDTLSVTREEVAAGVEEQLARLRERFETADEFRAALAAEGLSERDLRRRYEDDVQRQLLSRKLLEKEGLTEVYVPPSEAERFYNERRDSIARVPGRVALAHILVAVEPAEAAEAEARRRASEVLDILARGGDFGVVAGSFSDDAPTRGQGGDRGWRELAELPPDIAMVADQLQPGQVSPPFRGIEGYQVVRLEARSGDRVRLRTILLRVAVGRADTLRARNRALELRRLALEGAAFDSLARLRSDDPATAQEGGFLGEFLLEGLSAPFDTVVAGLDSGAVSEPVRSEHGLHLVKVLAREDERVMSYLEMQEVIRNYLQQQKLAARLDDYLARRSDRVFVMWLDGDRRLP